MVAKCQQGNAISLFSGAGGLDLGFARAGFDIVWANDICPDAVATHNALFDSETARAGCIEVLMKDLPKAGSVDLVIGGPPCQGFSVAGKMDPMDPRSRHVWTFLDIVEHIRPTAFVLENVKALARNSRWEGLRKGLVTKARALGFETELVVLDSSHFSVPQKRERMFLIGARKRFCTQALFQSTSNLISVRDALRNLPKWGHPGNDSLCRAVITPARAPVLRRSPYSGMLFNGQGRPINVRMPANTLPASMGGNRTPIVEQPILEDPAALSWVEEYHAHLWQGGSPTHSVPASLRRLTIQEAAALQTFPPQMYWSGSQSSVFRQIGNAVPPALGQMVAEFTRGILS